MDAKTLCLGVLTRGDASGYEIKKQLEEGPLAHFYSAGFGSIYPALTGLAEAGYVTGTEMVQEKRPGKKIYSITKAGLEAFRNTLGKDPSGDRIRSEYLFIMFFAHFLEPGRADEIFEGYLAQYRATVEAMCCADLSGLAPGQKFVHDFGLSIYGAIVEFMEKNRHVLADTGVAGAAPTFEQRAGAAE
ncbi:MAG: PadR family transcriptional regulator [Rhodospirillales bacterium]|jgi:PadR family transcriptional regulator, regulatory protein AphA|nr:PadR family transcriptional regulator [Rhodospirillales bacterium]